MAAGGTRAVEVLRRAGAEFRIHEYEVGTAAGSYGEAVAEALGVAPERMFKTLVAMVDGSPYVAIVPVSGQLAMKKLAAAAGGKRAEMASPPDAERLTGYVIGGISPLGQRRPMPALLDETALAFATVFVSGGRRGIQIELAPATLVELTGAEPATLAG